MSQSRIFNVANISFNVIRQNVNAICTNKILAKFSNLQLIRISVHSQPPKSSEERQRGMINDPNIKSDQEEEPRRLVASDGRASILSSKATQTPENFEYSEHYDKFRRKDTPKIAIGKVIK